MSSANSLNYAKTLQSGVVVKAVNDSTANILSQLDTKLSDVQKNEILSLVSNYTEFAAQKDPTVDNIDAAIQKGLVDAKDANEVSSKIVEQLNGSVFKTLLSYGLSNLSSVKLSVPDINKIINAASFAFVAALLEIIDKITSVTSVNPDA